jgi:hypothetical protein
MITYTVSMERRGKSEGTFRENLLTFGLVNTHSQDRFSKGKLIAKDSLSAIF